MEVHLSHLSIGKCRAFQQNQSHAMEKAGTDRTSVKFNRPSIKSMSRDNLADSCLSEGSEIRFIDEGQKLGIECIE